jgi:hypothetical protein
MRETAAAERERRGAGASLCATCLSPRIGSIKAGDVTAVHQYQAGNVTISRGGRK